MNNINIQRLNLSQKQIADEFSAKENTTIETDEASKFGYKCGFFGLRDSEGTPFVLGLRELNHNVRKGYSRYIKRNSF